MNVVYWRQNDIATSVTQGSFWRYEELFWTAATSNKTGFTTSTTACVLPPAPISALSSVVIPAVGVGRWEEKHQELKQISISSYS